VKYDAHYHSTSVDPPELIRFIKDNHPDVIFDYPRDKDGNTVIEDVKSEATKKDKTYVIKKKLMGSKGLFIREV